MKRQKTDQAPTSQADVARRGLVSVNRLDYVLQPDLSVCVSRSYKKHFFQQNSYDPSQRSIVILNSGAEYIDPQNSYISFTVENTGSATIYLGVGSGINFIRRLILTSRSGDELERVENVNLLAPVLDRYMRSRDWLVTHGKMIGYETYSNGGILDFSNNSTTILKGEGIAAGSSRTFVIPLSCLCGLFKFDRLLPSMLVSGLRMEIEWEAAAVACVSSATISWKINKPELTLDQYQLTDSIMRVLNEEAAMRGLEIVFSSFYNHTSAGPNGTAAAIEVRKAVSRALGVLTKIHANTGAASNTVDYMTSSKFDVTSYQLRLGSLYFPQQPIKSSGGSKGSLYEMFFHTLRGFGKIKTPSSATGVSPRGYDGLTTGGGIAAIYTDLERSNTQKLTGVPVNNSRVAQVLFETSASLSSRTIDLWLHYVRLLRVFLQNVEVEE